MSAESIREASFMNRSNTLLARFFGVAIRPQTYLNLLYLLLAFPLGLMYFIFLVVGLSLGLSLVIIWVGIPVLLLVFVGWWALAILERWLANTLLSEDIPPMTLPQASEQGTWARLGQHLANPVTWKSLVYLFAKFPLGLLSFILLVTLASVTLSCLAAPVLYPFLPLGVWFTDSLVWRIDTFWEALALFGFGAALFFPALHLLNGLAWISGRFARLMLSDSRAPTHAAARPEPPPPAAPAEAA
jgi:hypothetical protein